MTYNACRSDDVNQRCLKEYLSRKFQDNQTKNGFLTNVKVAEIGRMRTTVLNGFIAELPPAEGALAGPHCLENLVPIELKDFGCHVIVRLSV